MIMTRKNLILLLFSLLTLNSCNKHEGPELRFCENYIQNYCQGDLVLLSRSPDRPPPRKSRQTRKPPYAIFG